MALCINSAMTELNLEGNMLDAKAIAEIVKGLGQASAVGAQAAASAVQALCRGP